jgi:hypothetical protein
MNEQLSVGDTYISSAEAARRSGYSISGIQHLVSRGRIEARRKGMRWLIDVVSLDAFVRNRQARSKRGRPG